MYMRYFLKTVITITPKTTLKGAHNVMTFHGIRHLPLVDNGKVMGLISEPNLRGILDEISYRSDCEGVWKTPVIEYMTKDYIVVSPDDYLRGVAVKLIENESSAALIMDKDALVGIVTMKDMFQLLIRIMGFNEPGLRIQLEDGEKHFNKALQILIDQNKKIKSIYFLPNPEGTKSLHIRLDSIDAEEIEKEFGSENIIVKVEK
ncbi:MAG: CBS domain-containing protein [Thermodesulfobacteriota bacterium]|nr:CBS domain-containing protein [Thermodesulfobacteriota bacterium]